MRIVRICATQDISFGEAINRETVTTELVAALVGSIGIIAAVPLTTFVAALVATRLPVAVIPGAEHAHAH